MEHQIPELPEHLWRWPTGDAIESLAERFGLEIQPWMQDFEWDAADPARAEEFVTAYTGAGLSDDERFTLMELILESFEERSGPLEQDPAWAETVRLIEQNIALHIATVCHWAREEAGIGDPSRVPPFMREILARHIERFANPGNAVDRDR